MNIKAMFSLKYINFLWCLQRWSLRLLMSLGRLPASPVWSRAVETITQNFRPAIAPEQKQYIVSYGSLMEDESRHRPPIRRSLSHVTNKQ